MAHFEARAPALVDAFPPASYVPCVTFTPEQKLVEIGRQKIGPFIAAREARKTFFYSIEIAQRPKAKPLCLDFNQFLPMLPVFVSLAWMGRQYWNVTPIEQVKSLQLARHLAPRIPVMPHFTNYRLTDQRLDDFLDLHFRNVLAVRGNEVHPGQHIVSTKTLIERMKKNRGDKIYVCVAAFPEGYNGTDVTRADRVKHIKHLKEKVAAGAECIITQVCYKPNVIIRLVEDIRAAGIRVPILVGIMNHETYTRYVAMKKLTGVELGEDLAAELEQLHSQNKTKTKPDNKHVIRKFFVRLNVIIIRRILADDVKVYGFHFFSLNNFEAVTDTLRELRSAKLIYGKKP